MFAVGLIDMGNSESQPISPKLYMNHGILGGA